MHHNALSILKTSLLGLLILVVVGYGFFQAKKLLSGPVLVIYNPQNGATFSQSLVEIDGLAKNTTHIFLNDRPIYTDTTGKFSEKLLLSSGYNVIKLTASDKFGKKIEKKLELVLKEY